MRLRGGRTALALVAVASATAFAEVASEQAQAGTRAPAQPSGGLVGHAASPWAVAPMADPPPSEAGAGHERAGVLAPLTLPGSSPRDMTGRQVSSSCVPGPLPAPTTTTTTSTTTTTTSTTTTTTTPTTTTTTTPTTTTTAAPGATAGAAGEPGSSPTTTTTTTTTTTGTTGTTGTTVAPTTGSPGSTTTTSPAPPEVTTTTPAATAAPTAYYLFESDGYVLAYGAAAYHGSTASTHLPPVVSAAVAPDGGGYWLATVAGDVYHFGDAHYYGSPVHHAGLAPVVAIAGTPDGGGYWLVTSTGNVLNYGDAEFCGSAVHTRLDSPVVAFAPTPDGGGYWLVTAAGTVYNYGDALHLGSMGRAAPRGGVVAFAPTSNGKGYWLVTARGGVFNYGTAGFFGSAAHLHFPGRIVGIAATADSKGYWLATSTGRVFHFGDAHYAGSLLYSPPPKGVTIAAIAPGVAPVVRPQQPPFPAGKFGYDVSSYQCARGSSASVQQRMPTTSYVNVIQVAGWLDSSANPCLAAEAQWASSAAGNLSSAYSLYLFLNSPADAPPSLRQAADGPAGSCGALDSFEALRCAAYNYGYNGAEDALTYADAQGVSSRLWWLDIENAQLSQNDFSDLPLSYWSRSKALNDATIQGAMDALRRAGLTVGIYSTSLQYSAIAGDFTPKGPPPPLWVAGVPWTNPPYSEKGLYSPGVLRSWCAGSATYPGTRTADVFAGGVPWLLQETPGAEPSPYGLDPDYSC